MDRKIQKLSETVINQIAAGEVVENSASIVKELIENSLDAKPSQITVEIGAGGQQLIRIEDDGCGMSPEDALLSLERHATSKIRSVEDLQMLHTMGFRGEALAAISSVSQFELKTSNGVGTKVVVEGGKIADVGPCARNRGTTIEVRSLFYNVPARLKFQKSIQANTAQVTKIVETLALAHPEVEFILISNKKELFRLKKGSFQERIKEVLGDYEHEVKAEGVFGFVAAPSKATTTRSGQFLFINRRPIFSPLIAKAVKEAFGTRLGEHFYPPFVLFLEMDPSQFDVNVHPQKKEVRFRDEKLVFRKVQQAVLDVFEVPVQFSETLSFTPTAAFKMIDDPFPQIQEQVLEDLPFIYSGKAIGVFGRFFLMQEEKLLLIDLSRAHTRILFESLQREKSLSQALIWPLEIDIDSEEDLDALSAFGIECRFIGKKRMAVDALPAFLDAADFPIFLQSWKEKKKLDQLTHTFCRKIEKNYSLDQAIYMWQQLKKCRDSLYDPMGNKIWSEIRSEDFERMLL